jgi:hypothetical protein
MRNTGHIRQRSPKSWEIRYTLGTDPATGKRLMVTTTVRGSKDDAKKELRRRLRDLDTGDQLIRIGSLSVSGSTYGLIPCGMKSRQNRTRGMARS